MSSRKARGMARRAWLIAVIACIPAIAIVFMVTRKAPGEHMAAAANVWAPGPRGGAGGWGRGGYTMMPAPAGYPSPGSVANAANAAAATSQNWSGYASAGNPGTFTSVSASWSQPTVACAATQTFSSFWVGLDGDGTATVEQTGTEADCDGGTASYQGWFEMFPNAPVFYDNPVSPGDAMSASVVANGGGAFTLTLSDATQGWTQATSQDSATAQLGSAEVIAEAPSDGTVLPLSDFGTVDFTNATADGAPIGNAGPSAITMVSGAGVTEATPSALSGGSAFSVTFDGSGPGSGSASGSTPAPTATATATTTTTATVPGTGGSPGRHHHHHVPFGG